MTTAKIRKIVTIVEETHSEADQPIDPATRRAAAVAVIENPFAGRYVEDLETLMVIGEELGAQLGEACVTALGISPADAQSYGKAALVGENGELEHAAAILHPRLGRLVAMDAATTKGVIARLLEKDLVEARADPNDLRRLQISLTDAGRSLTIDAIEKACKITKDTVANLTGRDVKRLLELLDKM